MNLNQIAQNYMDHCKTRGYTDVKSIEPMDYELFPGAANTGIARFKVTTHSGRRIIIEHTGEMSYSQNACILKQLQL